MTWLVAVLAAAAALEALGCLARLRSARPHEALVALYERLDVLGRTPWLVRPLDRVVGRLDAREAPSTARLLVELEAATLAGAVLGAAAAGVTGSVLGALLPPAARLAVLRGRAARREASVHRDLPLVLDLVSMAVEGGLAVGAALDLAARRGPAGPLRDGLTLMVAAMSAGRSRSEALAGMRQSLPYPEVAALVTAIEQSDRLGGRLAPVLRAQAEQRRQARWDAAERRALLAPVRLLLPLAACILPATFVVLLVPLALRLAFGVAP